MSDETLCDQCGFPTTGLGHDAPRDCWAALFSRYRMQEQELADLRQRVAAIPQMQERIRQLEAMLVAVRRAAGEW